MKQLPLIPQEDAHEIRKQQAEDSRVVGTYVPRKGSLASKVRVAKGKPKPIVKTAMSMCGTGGMFGGSSFPQVSGTVQGFGSNIYSPELSTDYLELPQSIDEERNYYRFFAENDPFVAQALDLHTELPMSKLRLSKPKAKNEKMAKMALSFCEGWSEDINLLQHLLWITWEFHALGEVFAYMEDTNPKPPREVREKVYRELTEDGEAVEDWTEHEDADEREFKWLMANYKGFTAIRVIPPEQIHMDTFPLTDEKLFDFIPDSKLKKIINDAQQGDQRARKVVETYPKWIVQKVLEGKNIPLDTNPNAGSFLYYMARKKYQYAARGQSLLKRCLRELVLHDKLRQAQTSIASRHMTPMRIVYAKDMDEQDIDLLREQVDLALMDPDFSIITNFEVSWEEMGSNDRLLDLQSEYDLWSRKMYSGLGVTESLLSGETSYSGERINLEVINTRYMLLREQMQNFVEKYLFKPMCKRLGFVEKDEWGRDRVIYPRLSFTRLGIRDDADTRDFLYNLYLKNSLDIDTILEAVNLDPTEVKERLIADQMSIKDALWNEAIRSLYSTVGNMLAENSDAVEKIAKKLGVTYKKPPEGGGRF